MFKLALEHEGEIFQIGDVIEYKLKDEEADLIHIAQLTSLFKSVFSPHEIHLTTSDRPYYISIKEDDLIFLRKAKS